METKIKHFNPMALREKYSIGSEKRTNPFSSFWADTDWNTRRTEFVDEEAPKKKGVDFVQLASYRRAIANFVTIVTNRSDIPVRFQTRDSSYTDGKSVVIGSKINEKNFDPVVGLALHEGSHIKLSDFNFLKNLDSNIPQETYLDGEKVGFDKWDVTTKIKNLLNYVEDRRIDWYVFSSSPGYKGYYNSMYDKYFHSKVIDKGIKSDEYTSLDWDSYIFRILNLTNVNRRLDVLPGLNEIYKIIFNNSRVKKLTSTEDAFQVALEVFKVITTNLPEVTYDENGNVETPDNMTGNGDNMDGGAGDGSQVMSDDEFDSLLDSVELGDGNTIGGDSVSPTAGSDIETRGSYDYNLGEYTMMKNGCEVIYVKKLTQSMIDNSLFPYLLRSGGYYFENSPEWLTDGLSLGTKLGRKLQVRGESRDLKWNRLDAGRIDKRVIAELGFGNSRVFSQTFTESYSDAFLHISVDASGSMSGEKWKNTMTSVVAICKAVDMISNVDVQVSFRSTHAGSGRRGYSSGDNPLVLVGYDSRVDKFQKVKKMFPHIYPGGTTPEGLCFEALLKDIVPSTNNRDSYFLNLSDGMPMFSNQNFNYYNDVALDHTKNQVNEFRKMGIKVLSYFVGDSYGGDGYMNDFKRMYGSDAEFINLKNVTQISKTMNKKFLEKN